MHKKGKEEQETSFLTGKCERRTRNFICVESLYLISLTFQMYFNKNKKNITPKGKETERKKTYRQIPRI